MNGNYRAPNVTVLEKDESEIIPIASTITNIGALVGPTYKGPSNQRILIKSRQQFINTFGSPIDGNENEYYYYSALEFLKESGYLWFVRSTSENDKFGGLKIVGDDTYSLEEDEITEKDSKEVLENTGDGNRLDSNNTIEDIEKPDFFSIFTNGADKNSDSIGIQIITHKNKVSEGFDWEGKYPENEEQEGKSKYFKINVFVKDYEDDDFVESKLIESFLVTLDKEAFDYIGRRMFIEDVINGTSNYIYVKANDNIDDSYNFTENFVRKEIDGKEEEITPLKKGTVNLASSDVASAWDLFSEKEKSFANILISPYPFSNGVNNEKDSETKKVIEIASRRKDCVAVFGIGDKEESDKEKIVEKLNGLIMNSYTIAYAGWDLIYDTFSKKRIYLPKVIFGASVIARNDRIANVWDAPAGLSRGYINSLGQKHIYSEEEIGYLYGHNINTSKRIRGSGDYIWGQKTGQKKPTALDRINVRRLLLYIENQVEQTMNAFLFEPNNDSIRSRVESLVNSFLEGIYAGGGLYAYKVQCDELNNTPSVIDNNMLKLFISVQPTKTIEFIDVVVTVTNTGVTFE